MTHLDFEKEFAFASWLTGDDVAWYSDTFDGEVVEEAEDGWYFWDETWTGCFGPFPTREEANFASIKYAVEVLDGSDSST